MSRIQSISVVLCCALAWGCGDEPTMAAGGSGGTAMGGGGAGAQGGDGGNGGSAGMDLSCASEIDSSLIFAASEDPYGVSYEEWNARYMQWWASLPATTHPRNGGDCAQGQPGAPAWFLAPDDGGLAEHMCTVPADRGLLVDIETAFGLLIPDIDLNDCGCVDTTNGAIDYQCLRDFIADSWDMENWETCLEVNGVAVATAADLVDHLVFGGPWAYDPDPADPIIEQPPQYGPNNCGVTEGTDRELISRGYFVMLKPLSVGQHTLRWYVIPDGDHEPRGVTMSLTVE